tara:strand:- start:78 stop:287 length:210 start_codon:yes stop_codon:yes gene_type:complete
VFWYRSRVLVAQLYDHYLAIAIDKTSATGISDAAGAQERERRAIGEIALLTGLCGAWAASVSGGLYGFE